MIALLTSFLAAGGAAAGGTPQGGPNASNFGSPDVTTNVHHDTSAPLRSMAPAARSTTKKVREHADISPAGATSGQQPGALQTTTSSSVSSATSAGLNFAGVGNGDYGFAPNAAPPDTEGAVGATQYVQWVNESFAVFNKTTGAIVEGPVAGNTLWSGFGGGCQTNNDGDPIVQYDKAAQRWVFTQFSVSTTPYLQCVAVSKTSDATGAYYRYSFQQPNFPDYPKLGVWPDGYYLSFNMFRGNSFVGARLCSLDRNHMLTGSAATQICFQGTSSVFNLLPSDLDGSNPPPAGEPNAFVNFGTNSLGVYLFHTDFVNTSNAKVMGPTNLAVAPFSEACGGGTCIPQPGTNQQLDSLADRLMYRLAYRNLGGGNEAWVVNHSVVAGSSTGIRWYQLTGLNGSPSVVQQGTYAPDSNYRWMGSAAMDQNGDIAVGYSESNSSTVFPSIAITGRVPSDPAGTLEAETLVKAGGGSQTGGLTRWGDYSAMSVDPVDDCTFFYTNEYEKVSGSFNWSTQIASFKFSGCGGGSPSADFTMSASPTSLNAPQNSSPTSAITVSSVNGFSGSVGLTTSVSPNTGGVSASVSPTSVVLAANGSQTSTLTVSALSTATPGTYTVTVTGNGSSGTHSTSVTVTVPSPPPPPDFSMSSSPSSVTLHPNGSGSSTITVTSVGGFSGTVSLTKTVSPSSGLNVSLSSSSVGNGSGTVTLNVGPGSQGTYTVTVTGTSGSIVHSTTVTVKVNRH